MGSCSNPSNQVCVDDNKLKLKEKSEVIMRMIQHIFSSYWRCN